MKFIKIFLLEINYFLAITIKLILHIKILFDKILHYKDKLQIIL
jgi:hypothetical protein